MSQVIEIILPVGSISRHWINIYRLTRDIVGQVLVNTQLIHSHYIGRQLVKCWLNIVECWLNVDWSICQILVDMLT